MNEKFIADINENDINFLLESVTNSEVLVYVSLNARLPGTNYKMLKEKQEYCIILKKKLLELRDSMEIERNLKKGV